MGQGASSRAVAMPDLGVLRALTATRPWVLALAILGLCGIGFGLLAVAFTTRLLTEDAPLATLLGVGLVLALPSLQMLRYASALRRLESQPTAVAIATALRQQRLYWTLWGAYSVACAALLAGALCWNASASLGRRAESLGAVPGGGR